MLLLNNKNTKKLFTILISTVIFLVANQAFAKTKQEIYTCPRPTDIQVEGRIYNDDILCWYITDAAPGWAGPAGHDCPDPISFFSRNIDSLGRVSCFYRTDYGISQAFIAYGAPYSPVNSQAICTESIEKCAFTPA